MPSSPSRTRPARMERRVVKAARVPSNRKLLLRLLDEMKHGPACKSDPEFTGEVCNGTYIDRVESNLGLVEALRAVYALVGQNKQVRKIIEDAIEEHGV